MKRHNKYKKNHLKKYVMVVAMIGLSVAVAYQKGGNKNHYPRSQMNEYNKALKILWTKVYPNKGNTLYCEKTFSTKNRQERKKHVNAEHVFPMAWVTKELRCGTRKQCKRTSPEFRQIESDLHNIYPAVIKLNRARGSYRFGDIKGEKRQFGACDFEVDRQHRVAEPRPEVHGDVARAMLYMEYQYGLKLHKKTKALMLKWDREDPPSAEEKRRAKIIEREQGRENPFITRYPFKP